MCEFQSSRILILKGQLVQKPLGCCMFISYQGILSILKQNNLRRFSDETDAPSNSEQLQKLLTILQKTNTKEEFQKVVKQEFSSHLEAVDEDMAAFLKNLASGFNDIMNAAQAKISPNTVQATTAEKLIGTTVVKQSGCLTLHRREGAISTLECTISRPETSGRTFSLFRYTAAVEAETVFNSFESTVAPIVGTGLITLQEDILQSLSDCVREHPLWTSAHVAAYLGHAALLKCPGILENADRPSGTHQRTPLMVALMGKQAPSIEELLKLGVNLNKKDKSGDTAYHYAVLNNCSPIVALLVDYDKEGVINWLNGKGESALLMACQRKMFEATESLLGAGADPRIAAADCLPVHAAVKACDMKSVEAIIKLYPEQANAKDFKYGGTPIHWAENSESIQKLSFFGCNANILNNEGNAPLHVMMQKLRRECMMALLCHGADCNIKDATGETVLHKAIKSDDLELVRQFVVFGADVNLPTNDGQTPRHLASISKGKSNPTFLGSSKHNRETILYLLHVSGANRCPKTAKGCLKGCVSEGNFNGTPDQTMAALMKLDSVALFDEQLMANVVHSVHSPQSQSAVIDMVDSPMSAGDRVLCLDGGGIKGLVLIQILMEIENSVGRPIKDCFDWIGGTSTGAILALGIAKGISLQYLKGIYVRLKDEVFKGSRPYETAPFEALLRREFGEHSMMADIKKPKVIVTAVLADRYPAELTLFRNYEPTLHHPISSPPKKKNEYQGPKLPGEQLIWEAARASGAAPTYFRGHGAYLDGGLMANNPTLDVLTEIHEHNFGLKMQNRASDARPIGCVISLGCGRVPCIDVENVDVFRPGGLIDLYKTVSGASALGRLIVDQATISEGRPVDRARAWCSMINTPYYRFSPLLSDDISLDCHDERALINMMWETQCYMVANRHRVHELVTLLRPGPG
ncbi:hypothetical protein RRG08_049831 [Elysia crispata]|uniref:phospholipase A2 n=1 Tax=Elysia crispata TaxID=231223 RepID=A0AAE1DMT4_9GAST|nr:hypothetical protein RRG08_049831 [Elysia crispata]